MLNISKINNSFSKISVDFSVETDNEKIAEANPGKQQQTCKLCNSSGEFQSWSVIENFFGTGEEFIYFECPKCEILQIDNFPEDIARHYPSNYYSYNKPNTTPAAPGTPVKTPYILDVGCGAGNWLCEIARQGFVNVHGCDPFAAQDYEYENGVKIKKCSIHEMDGEYDVIHLSHVFEHMPDPDDVFATFSRLLRRDAIDGFQPYIEIHIPIYPNIAFDIYGPFWYQLDAPRHYFIHSIKSVTALAEKRGFKLHEKIYNSANYLQFTVSRTYQMGIPFTQYVKRFELDRQCELLKQQLPMYKNLAQIAAENCYSDEVCLKFVWG